jgi:hypothetical protein
LQPLLSIGYDLATFHLWKSMPETNTNEEPEPDLYDAFISYSKEDEKRVRPIVGLMRLSDRRVFWANDSIEPGTDWEHKLKDALSGSALVVVLWCCDASQSKWMNKELSWARKAKKRIMPVTLCQYPLPRSLRRIQWLDISDGFQHPCDHSKEPPSSGGEQVSPSPSPRPARLVMLSNGRSFTGEDLHQITEELDRGWRRATQERQMFRAMGIPFLLILGVYLNHLVDKKPFSSPFSPEVTDVINADLRRLAGILFLAGVLWLFLFVAQSVFGFVRRLLTPAPPTPGRAERESLRGISPDYDAETVGLLVRELVDSQFGPSGTR